MIEQVGNSQIASTENGSNTLKIAVHMFAHGKFKEAIKLYKKAIDEDPNLRHTGININLAHSIILSTDWSEVSNNLPSNTNYLESSGWLNSLFLGKPVNHDSMPIPWYTYPAIEFIENKLKSDFRVFEYGSGQSTLWWAERVAQVVSVESDPMWFSYIKDNVPDNVKLDLIEEEYKYASEILNYPDNYFDIIIIDGSARNMCAEICVDKLNKDGFIIFDNTDSEEYIIGVEALLHKNLKRIDFYGLIPSYTYKNCTSVFFDTDDVLLRGSLPNEKQSCLGLSCFQRSNPQSVLAKENSDDATLDRNKISIKALKWPKIETLSKNIEYFQKETTNQELIHNIRQIRKQIAEHWLYLPAEQLQSSYLGNLGREHQMLLNSGIKDEPLNEPEQAFIEDMLG